MLSNPFPLAFPAHSSSSSSTTSASSRISATPPPVHSSSSSGLHTIAPMPPPFSAGTSSAAFSCRTDPLSAYLLASLPIFDSRSPASTAVAAASSSGAAVPSIGITTPISLGFGPALAPSMTTSTAEITPANAAPSSCFTPALFVSQASTCALSSPVVRASRAASSSSSSLTTTTTLASTMVSTAASSAMARTAALPSQLQSTSAASAVAHSSSPTFKQVVDRFQCRSAISLSEVLFDFLREDMPSLPPHEFPNAEEHIENSLKSIQLLGVDVSVLRASVAQIVATAREVCELENSLDPASIKECLKLRLSRIGRQLYLFTSLVEEDEQTLTGLRRRETSEWESIQKLEAEIASLKVKLEDAIEAKDAISREIEAQKLTVQETKDNMKKVEDEEIIVKGELDNLEAEVAHWGQDLINKRTHLKELLDSLSSLAWI